MRGDPCSAVGRIGLMLMSYLLLFVLDFQAMGASSPLQPREQLAVHDAMASARQQLQATELSDASLARCIEASDSPFPHTDPDLLLLKATSAASMQCLLQCLGILHRQQQYATVNVTGKLPEDYH
ncbi:uncharacterized protein LOC113234145 [Hyposmocoma kahamanoa]|uniref:uncharacterized protein LOC113234145 n=1 Tax=Hyposmocoma kahamanoa TaxID=1477025 RepID=UPI000E6D7DD3|nr:uncharacterized protein LOC113234145 [Hyposmocoma kahamanoa]